MKKIKMMAWISSMAIAIGLIVTVFGKEVNSAPHPDPQYKHFPILYEYFPCYGSGGNCLNEVIIIGDKPNDN